MSSTIETLHSLQSALEEKRRFFRKLPEVRETLGQKRFRLHQLAACVEDLERQLGKLESVSLTRLIGALSGGNAEKAAKVREELEEMLPQFEQLAEEVDALEQAMSMMQSASEGLEDVQREFERAVRRRRDELLESNDPALTELKSLVEQADAAREEMRCIERAIDDGEKAIDRVHSLTKRRALVGPSHPKPRDRIDRSCLINKGLDQVAAGSVTALARASAGSRKLETITIDPDIELDGEIVRIRALLEEQATSLTTSTGLNDSTFLMPLVELIHECIGHIKTKRDTLRAEVTALVQQEQRFVLDA